MPLTLQTIAGVFSKARLRATVLVSSWLDAGACAPLTKSAEEDRLLQAKGRGVCEFRGSSITGEVHYFTYHENRAFFSLSFMNQIPRGVKPS